MKKIILCATMMLFSLMCVFAQSCSVITPEGKLKSLVKEVNKEFPKKVGEIAELSGCVYENNTLTFFIAINDKNMIGKDVYINYLNIDVISKNHDMKANCLRALLDKSVYPLFDMLIECDASLTLLFIYKTSGKEERLTYTANEIKEELEKPIPINNEEKLKAMIATKNAQMPMIMESGMMIITEVVEKGDLVVYMVKITNKELFNQLASKRNILKENFKNMLKRMAHSDMLFRQIIDADKGVEYLYYMEDDDKTIDITFTNSELLESLRKNK